MSKMSKIQVTIIEKLNIVFCQSVFLISNESLLVTELKLFYFYFLVDQVSDFSNSISFSEGSHTQESNNCL